MIKTTYVYDIKYTNTMDRPRLSARDVAELLDCNDDDEPMVGDSDDEDYLCEECKI